jgi:hydrogenase maturation protein HypF
MLPSGLGLRQRPSLTGVTCWHFQRAVNQDQFHIVPGLVEESDSTTLPPDLATCSDCLHELMDPQDPRYRYAFINCTNCGARFSITTGVPYGRSRTTMATFVMCSRCEGQYRSQADRRFHAEPITCPKCGPTLFIAGSLRSGQLQQSDPVRHAISEIAHGAIIALRGIGGFQLVCDAFNRETVERLRNRKQRSRNWKVVPVVQTIFRLR